MKTLRGSVLTAFAVVALLTSSGCSVYHGEFSVLSNRVLDLTDFDPEAAKKKGQFAEGASERKIIVLFPDRGGFPTLDEAIDKTLAEGGGDLILNAQVLSWNWYIPYVYGTSGWKVVGDVVNTGTEGAKVEPLTWTYGGLLAVH